MASVARHLAFLAVLPFAAVACRASAPEKRAFSCRTNNVGEPGLTGADSLKLLQLPQVALYPILCPFGMFALDMHCNRRKSSGHYSQVVCIANAD